MTASASAPRDIDHDSIRLHDKFNLATIPFLIMLTASALLAPHSLLAQKRLAWSLTLYNIVDIFWLLKAIKGHHL